MFWLRLGWRLDLGTAFLPGLACIAQARAVYEESGEVVGVTALAVLWADLSEVRSLAVDDRHRGKGIGSKLVQHCLKEARKAGCYKVILNCFDKNIPFYEKLGFRRHEIEMRFDF